MNAHAQITEADLANAIAEEAGDFSSGTEFGPDMYAEVDMDFADPRTLVKRARSKMQKMLDGLSARKRVCELGIALADARLDERNKAAQTAFETEKAAAMAEWTAALDAAEAELAQVSACRDAVDLAVGRLNRAGA